MKAPQKIAAVLGVTLVACALVVLGVSAWMPAPSGQAGEGPADPPSAAFVLVDEPTLVDYRQLDARIAELMQDPNMVGLAVGTIERGQVRFMKGYGETLANSGAPVTPDTVFRWASLSKGVAAALVAGLVEEGKLSLDTPLETMGTTLRLPGDARGVTVADILSHRVGIVRHAWDDRLEAGEDPKTLRAALGTLKPYCPPATCHTYQNIAFDVAAEIVEAGSGEDYASFARRRLFAPLGMTATSIGRVGLEGSADWARPHRKEKSPTIVNDNYYRVPAAGGVNSSIRDLVLWMGAQMGDAPEVLSTNALQMMQRPMVATPAYSRRGPMDRALSNAAYGLGWRTFSYAGRTLVGHRGSVDGYGALILLDPADRSGIVMLWNSNNPRVARLQLEFFDMLYGLPFTDWLETTAEPSASHAAVIDDRAG